MTNKFLQWLRYVIPCAFVLVAVATLVTPTAHAQSQIIDFDQFRIGLLRGSAESALQSIVNFILFIGGIVAFLFVLWGGFVYLTAGGDAARATQGRTFIVNALIGIIIIFLSYAIVRFVTGFTNERNPEDAFRQGQLYQPNNLS